MRLVEGIRNGAAKALILTAGIVAPTYMRRVLGHTLQAMTGMAEEIEAGRDGGVMITPWFVSDSGSILAHIQAIQCVETAQQVRAIHEAKERRP